MHAWGLIPAPLCEPSASQLLILRTASLHTQLWHKFWKIDLVKSMLAAESLGEPWLHSQNRRRTFTANFESPAVSGLASSLRLSPRLWPFWANLSQSEVSAHKTTHNIMSSFILSTWVGRGEIFGRCDLCNTRAKTNSTWSYESQCMWGRLWNHLGPFPSHSHILVLDTILPRWQQVLSTNGNTRHPTCRIQEPGICAGTSV